MAQQTDAAVRALACHHLACRLKHNHPRGDLVRTRGRSLLESWWNIPYETLSLRRNLPLSGLCKNSRVCDLHPTSHLKNALVHLPFSIVTRFGRPQLCPPQRALACHAYTKSRLYLSVLRLELTRLSTSSYSLPRPQLRPRPNCDYSEPLRVPYIAFGQTCRSRGEES